MPLRLLFSRRRRAFTTVELFVILVILLLLLSIFIPFIRKTRETDHRVRCASNLQGIGSALTRYAESNAGAFPRVVADAGGNYPGYFAYTGPFAENPFAGDAQVSANDVTASLWLLVRGGYAPPSLFICASSSDIPDPLTNADAQSTEAQHRSNFKRARNLSYSYASPFSAAPGYRLNSYLPSDFVIAADKNPGKSATSDVTLPVFNAPPIELAKANSNNHRQAGQNVLYAGMYVQFQPTPFAGLGGDNIYTALAEKPLPETPQPERTTRGVVGPQYSPAWKADSYLVPTEDQDRK